MYVNGGCRYAQVKAASDHLRFWPRHAIWVSRGVAIYPCSIVQSQHVALEVVPLAAQLPRGPVVQIQLERKHLALRAQAHLGSGLGLGLLLGLLLGLVLGLRLGLGLSLRLGFMGLGWG